MLSNQRQSITVYLPLSLVSRLNVTQRAWAAAKVMRTLPTDDRHIQGVWAYRVGQIKRLAGLSIK